MGEKREDKVAVNVRLDRETHKYIRKHPLYASEGLSGVARHLLRLGRRAEATEREEASRG